MFQIAVVQTITRTRTTIEKNRRKFDDAWWFEVSVETHFLIVTVMRI